MIIIMMENWNWNPILGDDDHDDDEKRDPILGESSSLSCDGALVSSAAPA